MLFLVPIYSFLSTMANLQSYHSRHTPVMVSDVFAVCFLAPCYPSCPFVIQIFIIHNCFLGLNGHSSILNAPPVFEI